MNKLGIGDAAPQFDLLGSSGRLDLEHFRGRWLVLYFYPADFTSGCTTEACDFRDLLPHMDADVVGVSPDPPERHGAFEQKYALPFPLLSDEDLAIAERYGTLGTRQDGEQTVRRTLRSTFIIDPEGKIAAALYDVKASEHAEQVRRQLETLQATNRP